MHPWLALAAEGQCTPQGGRSSMCCAAEPTAALLCHPFILKRYRRVLTPSLSATPCPPPGQCHKSNAMACAACCLLAATAAAAVYLRTLLGGQCPAAQVAFCPSSWLNSSGRWVGVALQGRSVIYARGALVIPAAAVCMDAALAPTVQYLCRHKSATVTMPCKPPTGKLDKQ